MDIHHFEFLKHLLRFRRTVYLDHNATTAVSSRVRRTMSHVLKHHFGNPSSLYGQGRRATEIIDKARGHVAAAIHAHPSEVIFTGCATESNNAVLVSLSRQFLPKKRKIVTTPIEHPSIISTLEFLRTQGVVVEYCRVDRQGRVVLDQLREILDNDTFLLCCMLANNEVGTIQDVATIARVAHERGVLVLSDCVQALGKIPVDVQALGVDYASFSAHKLHGPKGVGALYVREGSPLEPFIHGGHQESGKRAGTESLHNIAGCGAACRDVNRLLAQSSRVAKLRDYLIHRIKEVKPDCVINSLHENCLPNTINVTLPGVSNAKVLAMLDYHGVAVSAGSACSSMDDKPSHVLKAIGLSDPATKETIRLSLGHRTSVADIRYAIRALKTCIEGRTYHVKMIAASQLTQSVVFDKQMYLLDVRPQSLRRKFKSIPNAHEVSFVSLGRYLHLLPRDKNIVVICQGGGMSYMAAYYLRSRGFENVGNLVGGLDAWRKRHADLYGKCAGQGVTVLQPAP